MKWKTKARRLQVKIWFYMMIFASVVLFLIWTLQTQFLDPYYLQSRVNSSTAILDKIEMVLLNQNDYTGEEINITTIQQYLETNNSCGYFIDYTSAREFSFNRSNASCFYAYEPGELIAYADQAQANQGTYSETYTSADGQKRYLRIEKMENEDLSNEYYVMVSMSLEIPVSTVQIVRSQFSWISLAVLVSSVVVALFIANRLSKPVKKMNQKAALLADGDFAVRFEHGGYLELNELADTLNYATEEMERTDELRRDLVANVSHDIKTPLTMIKAYAEMIQDISGNNPAKREEHLQVILKETRYLTNLVNDMLEISKYQSNTLPLVETNYNLTKQVNDIVSMYENNDKQVVIHCEVAKNCYAYGDEIKMGQVLSNYLGNAIKHCQDHKEVWVKVQAQKNHYRIEVIDQGYGIAPEDIKNIWDRYFKIDKNYQRNIEGTGLGLSIVKSICESAHCEYGVNSEVGKGSTFYFVVKKGKEKP